MPEIKVRLRGNSYPIVIGTKLDRKLVALVKKHSDKTRVFVLIDSNVFVLYGNNLESVLIRAKLNIITLVIPSGEKSKSHTVLNKIYDFLISEKISRNDFVLAVGGGVLTDIAGYAAATVLRGIKWGAVSTTLLGMVDAAIGGKTGINHNHGKNLVGAFWHPSFVLCDLSYLNTLPDREIIAGLGEVLKYAGLTGTKSIKNLRDFLFAGDIINLKRLKPIIDSSAGYKAKIVSLDERESNKRMFLNFGHTFAHALEKHLGYGKLLHGEAVIIGILAAVIFGKKHNPQTTHALKEYEELVKTFVRFVRYYPVKAQDLLENMKIDKKRSGVIQKFVLLERPGRPFIASNLKEHMIKQTLVETLTIYKEIGARRV